jgi:hypothetical protein
LLQGLHVFAKANVLVSPPREPSSMNAGGDLLGAEGAHQADSCFRVWDGAAAGDRNGDSAIAAPRPASGAGWAAVGDGHDQQPAPGRAGRLSPGPILYESGTRLHDATSISLASTSIPLRAEGAHPAGDRFRL